ncbi:FlgD immunoglobulin-like domain containing protein [Danxiaibacter flavus]|uniref:FlgD immunoglobulin-like domain containing protein n=1 Tax=Danxiaibacter flavus TaxID=3049108 RepID=A0ABV3ZM44_9BACT|nr:FlgD immunoglobulin-like domain containing protein [Chitinophagaceae bacterium DXS]
MKKQQLKKVLQFIILAITFFTLADSVNAQKKCHNGKCPIGYACAPSGYCVRYCSHCQPFLIESADEVVSAESSQFAVIRFQMDEAKAGSVKIYDIAGRLVRTLLTESVQQGVHQFLWNAKDENGSPVATGIYIIQLNEGNKMQTRKLFVVS